MRKTLIQLAIYLLMVAIWFFVFIIIFNFIKKAKTKAKTTLENTVKKHNDMNAFKLKLSKLGIMYRSNDYNLSPTWYVTIKIFVGILFTVLNFILFSDSTLFSHNVSRLVLFIAFPIGYKAVDLYYIQRNKMDNKDMMLDLYNTYASLKLQIDAGIYVGDALEYAAKNANNKRYKEALNELLLNMANTTIDMAYSIEIFKSRFKNSEIDKLCNLLSTFFEFGASKEYTEDIMGEIQTIIEGISMASEQDLENKAGLVAFSFFGIVIILVMYSIVVNFSGVNLF